MAIYRQIQINYWQDKFILKLTPEEKFFYLYLLTNSKTKQCGIYELPLQIIQLETGYNRETTIKLLQRFIDHGKIKYDWENEEIFLLNWLKHNPFDKNPNIRKCIKNELLGVHNTAMIPLDSPLQALLQKEKEEEEKKEEEKEFPQPNDVIEYFVESGYPREWGEGFFSYYDAQGWKTTAGISIAKRWQSKVIGWLNNQKQYEIKNDKKRNSKNYVDPKEAADELASAYSKNRAST